MPLRFFINDKKKERYLFGLYESVVFGEFETMGSSIKKNRIYGKIR